LHAEFGSGVAGIVEDLTLKVFRDREPADRDLTLIAIADRLHNLRTIGPLPAAKRRRAPRRSPSRARPCFRCCR
jgi:GTP pyrophosphokinase